MRPSLDIIKQASSNAFSKAQLMVGLNDSKDIGDGVIANDDIELANSNSKNNNNNSGDDDGNTDGDGDNPARRSSSFRGWFGREIEEEESSRGSNGSNRFIEEATDLLCPELTFQQRLLGFATCFTIACKYIVESILTSVEILILLISFAYLFPTSMFALI